MKRVTRAKAIRLKCIDCCAGQPSEVRRCTAVKCPLFPYRMGREDKELYAGDVDDVDGENPEKLSEFDPVEEDDDDVDNDADAEE